MIALAAGCGPDEVADRRGHGAPAPQATTPSPQPDQDEGGGDGGGAMREAMTTPPVDATGEEGGSSEREDGVRCVRARDDDGALWFLCEDGERVLLEEATPNMEAAPPEGEGVSEDDENRIEEEPGCPAGHVMDREGVCLGRTRVGVSGRVTMAENLAALPPALNPAHALTDQLTPTPHGPPAMTIPCAGALNIPPALSPAMVTPGQEALYTYGGESPYGVEFSVGGFAWGAPLPAALTNERVRSYHAIAEAFLTRQTIQVHELIHDGVTYRFTTLFTLEGPLDSLMLTPSQGLSFYAPDASDIAPFFQVDAARATLELIILDTQSEEVSSITCDCDVYMPPPDAAF